jgi:hypothetical protein
MDQGADERNFETSFERDTETGLGRVDFAMVSGLASQNERMWTRFETTDGDAYSIFFLRKDVSHNMGMAFALKGAKSTGKAFLSSEMGPSAVGTASLSGSSSGTCLDLATEGASTGCATAQNTLTTGMLGAASTEAAGFTIDAVAAMSLSTL